MPSASCKNYWAENLNLLRTQIVELGESCLQLFTFSFSSHFPFSICALRKNFWAENLNYLRAQHVGPAAQILKTFAVLLSWCFGAVTDGSSCCGLTEAFACCAVTDGSSCCALYARALYRSLYKLLSPVTHGPCRTVTSET